VIANTTNRGLAAANNQGLAVATGDHVLIANPDTVPQPGAVMALMDVLQRHERAAFVVPRLQYEDGRVQTSAGDLPSLSAALLGRQAERLRRSEHGFWWDGWAHDEERSIGRGHEAFYLVRREALAEIGPQDEGFFLDWEGPDWTARARDLGWEVWFAPGAVVVHEGGASIKQVPLRGIVHSHRGMFRYFAKRRPMWQRPLLAIAITARGMVKAAAQGAARRSRFGGRTDRSS
jgi:GT2 family glycosyltransferase